MTSLRSLLRRGAAITALIAAFALLAACSTPSDTGGDATEEPGDGAGGGTVTVADGAVELSAADLEFDATVIEATAGEGFTITFTNNDTAPHNVAIYTEEGGDAIVTGEVIDGGATTEVQVDALDAGDYYFQCDVHPDMNGTVTVSG